MKRKTIGYQQETGEINTLPSLTVPDQAMTIEELLLNHTRGIMFPGEERIPIYNEDFDMNIKGLDLVELDMLKEQIREQENEAREKLKYIEKLKNNREKIDKEQEKETEEKS